MAGVSAVFNHSPLRMLILYHTIDSSDITWRTRAESVSAQPKSSSRIGRRTGPGSAINSTPLKGTF